jgi:hypothetical protein
MLSEPSGISSNQPDRIHSQPSQPKVPPFDHPAAGGGSGGGGLNSLRQFLGEEGFAEFQKTYSQMILNQMVKEQAIMKETSRKLKDALTGQDDD